MKKSPPLPATDRPKEASGIAVHCAYDDLQDIVNLVAHPRNPNRHPDKQVALLAKVIRHQGWRSPIVVSRRSGFIVTGHGRYQAAKVLGVEKVPVNFQDFATEADELAHLVADNRIAELADGDDDGIAALLKELGDAKLDLDLTGYDAGAIDDLLAEVKKDSEADEEPTASEAEVGGKFLILVTCKDETDQTIKLTQFQEQGIPCKAM